MPDQCCGDPKLPPGGGAPDVSSATGVLPVAHGGTGADLSNSAAAKVLATPPGATGPVALRSLAAEHLPSVGTAGTVVNPASITFDAHGRATAYTDGSPSSGLSWTDTFFDPIAYARKRLTGGIGGGLWTIGVRFLLTRAATVNMAFAWPTAGANSVVCDLWTAGGIVATATVAVNAVREYAATFDYAVDDDHLYQEYYATTHIPTGGYISYNVGGGNVNYAAPQVGGPGLLYLNLNAQAANHAQPTTFSPPEWSAIRVVLS